MSRIGEKSEEDILPAYADVAASAPYGPNNDNIAPAAGASNTQHVKVPSSSEMQTISNDIEGAINTTVGVAPARLPMDNIGEMPENDDRAQLKPKSNNFLQTELPIMKSTAHKTTNSNNSKQPQTSVKVQKSGKNNKPSYKYSYANRNRSIRRGCNCCNCDSCDMSCCRCTRFAAIGGASLFFIVFFTIWFGISGTVFGLGISSLSESIEYANEATTEQCLLVSKHSKSCTYDCDCTGSGDDRDCKTCSSRNYKFTALAEDKCGDTEISYSESDCPGTSWEIGSYKKCYVLDCKDEEFSLNHFSESMVAGILMIVFGGLFICCGCCAMCGFAGGFCCS